MKEITMYELIGLVNDGKAPNEVIYNDCIYSYVDRNRLFAKYIREPFNAKMPYYLFTDATSMNDIIEIPEEKEIPEKIPEIVFLSTHAHTWAEKEKVIVSAINETIDYLQYIKNKGE